MTSRTSAHVPTAPCDPRLQRLAWFSPAAVVLAAVVWNVGAWAIDASAIAQPAYSFGVSFAAVIYSVVLGVPVLLLQALVAGVATWAAAAVLLAPGWFVWDVLARR